MNITEVRVRKVNGDGKLKAFASITIDNAFVVHDLKVIEGKKGYFVAMPSRKTTNGEFKDTAHPIVTETREKIQAAVLNEFDKIKNLVPPRKTNMHTNTTNTTNTTGTTNTTTNRTTTNNL